MIPVFYAFSPDSPDQYLLLVVVGTEHLQLLTISSLLPVVRVTHRTLPGHVTLDGAAQTQLRLVLRGSSGLQQCRQGYNSVVMVTTVWSWLYT